MQRMILIADSARFRRNPMTSEPKFDSRTACTEIGINIERVVLVASVDTG